ncbi:MAG: glutathione transferase GstA [Burkholderiales bacterium]|nr:glutathione transferase GstA [Burkholderiales bacterium]GIK86206.1 MAG: glutathione S-transferase [Betaproteobacteria bacterium]
MKLYFAPGACSFAPHIVVHELGLPVQAVKVDLRSHTLADGTDYYAVNPKGYVPLLELDDGTRLAEVAVILQYLADRKPGTLAPPLGTLERYRVMEWLNFIATEIHKGFGPLWYPDTPAATREKAIAALGRRFALVDEALARHAYVAGETFTVADAYLYTVLNWTKFLKVDIAPWPRLAEYLARVAQRPAVQAAKAAESSPAK